MPVSISALADLLGHIPTSVAILLGVALVLGHYAEVLLQGFIALVAVFSDKRGDRALTVLRSLRELPDAEPEVDKPALGRKDRRRTLIKRAK
jgi:hypothetical protein